MASPGQLVMTRPPLTLPPINMATDPVRWSAPPVQLTAAVRPNSVATSTVVVAHAGQREHDLSKVFNGLRYIVKTGAPWRWMPNDLPPRAE